MAGWVARRGGRISGIKTSVIHSPSPCARHHSHHSTLSRSLNSHSSLQGRASSCPVSQMRRLRLSVTKGPVMITQLVKGKARPQSRVWGTPELCFHHGCTPHCLQQNPAEVSRESARGSLQGVKESGWAPWVLKGQFKGQRPSPSQHWALPKSCFHILGQGWSPGSHGDIEPSRLERRASGTLWDC